MGGPLGALRKAYRSADSDGVLAFRKRQNHGFWHLVAVDAVLWKCNGSSCYARRNVYPENHRVHFGGEAAPYASATVSPACP